MMIIGEAFKFNCLVEDFDGWIPNTVIVHAIGETQAREYLNSLGGYKDVILVTE